MNDTPLCKRQLTDEAVHEFNNLHTVILGCCQFLEKDGTLSDDSLGLINEIQKATRRASKLTQQLLSSNRSADSNARLEHLNEFGIGTEETLPAETLPPINCDIESEEHSARGTETVLVVDDRAVVRSVACRILCSQGYTVLEAECGDDALLACEQHRGSIHLVLMDVAMPKTSGRELSERLRSRWPDLKVLFMSGYTIAAATDQGLLEAETNFIQKPFSPQLLTQRVREVLDGPL